MWGAAMNVSQAIKKPVAGPAWLAKKLSRGDAGETCQGLVFCRICSVCRGAEYNRRSYGLKPLDRPGTEAYFMAVWASLQRQATPKQPHPQKRVKALKRGRRLASNLSPQNCTGYCGRFLQNEPVLAFEKVPVVFCLPCAEQYTAWGKSRNNAWLGQLLPARVGGA